MRYTEVCLRAFGYQLPETVLTTSALEEQLAPLYETLNIPAGRIEKLTGVRERRLWPVGTEPSSLAAKAAKNLFEKNHIEAQEIDALIFCGVSRDAVEPATAAMVHDLLRLSPACGIFDVSNACLGFFNGMVIAANMIELRQAKNVLLVSGENAGPLYADSVKLLNEKPSEALFRKSMVNFTLGSAAVAMLLSRRDPYSDDQHLLLGGVGQTYSAAHRVCRGYGDIHHQWMETDPQELMEKGLALAAVNWEFFRRELGWEASMIDHSFTHQVSRSHHERVFERLGLDISKGYSEIGFLGNSGSVAAPLSLALAAEAGRLKRGDKAALFGIGSGLSTLMLGVRW